MISDISLDQALQALPKAELHVHLEGSIEPATAVELAARHGVELSTEEVAGRYAPGDFMQFIEAFKWVTSFARTPADYALIARRLAESLRAQNVLYAEVTLSIGVMIRREQDVPGIFRAVREAVADVPGIRIAWIFDAVRQWGADAAMQVARLAVQLRSPELVAFGIGGDELALPVAQFRAVYDYVAEAGLHRLIHAGEVGDAQCLRDAVEILGVVRIGHGISALQDDEVMSLLAECRIPLELCPTSNVRTGALARQLGCSSAESRQHPLPMFFRRGMEVTLSSDDPAMFETSLNGEYIAARKMGLSPSELLLLAEASFRHAFLPEAERLVLLHIFHSRAAALGLV